MRCSRSISRRGQDEGRRRAGHLANVVRACGGDYTGSATAKMVQGGEIVQGGEGGFRRLGGQVVKMGEHVVCILLK